VHYNILLLKKTIVPAYPATKTTVKMSFRVGAIEKGVSLAKIDIRNAWSVSHVPLHLESTSKLNATF
jgi:hypothetical protein